MNGSHRALYAVVGLTALVPWAARGQTASTSVEIVRGGVYANLSFPGLSGGASSAAYGNNVQLPISSAGGANVGNGSLSTIANAVCNGAAQPPLGTPALGAVSVVARASMTDVLTLTTDASLPVTMEFAVRASGSVSTTRSVHSPSGGAFEASVSWQAALGVSSASGGVREDYPFLVTPFVRERRVTQSGLGMTEFILLATVAPGPSGTTLTLSLSSESTAGGDAVFSAGEMISATADFGSTLRWRGLSRATLPDGSPFTGRIGVLGASGFNYLVPEPGTLVLVGFGVWGVARRRRS